MLLITEQRSSAGKPLSFQCRIKKFETFNPLYWSQYSVVPNLPGAMLSVKSGIPPSLQVSSWIKTLPHKQLWDNKYCIALKWCTFFGRSIFRCNLTEEKGASVCVSWGKLHVKRPTTRLYHHQHLRVMFSAFSVCPEIALFKFRSLPAAHLIFLRNFCLVPSYTQNFSILRAGRWLFLALLLQYFFCRLSWMIRSLSKCRKRFRTLIHLKKN